MPVESSEAVDQSEEILCDIIVRKGMKALGMTPNELLMAEALSARFMEMADELAAGKKFSWEELHEEMDRIGEQFGYEGGIPIPALSHERNSIGDLIVARGVPLRGLLAYQAYRTELEERLSSRGYKLRNSWESLGDRTCGVVNTTEGPYAMWVHHAGWRLQKLMATMTTRMDSQVTVEAEQRAIDSLKTRLSASQFRCYMINGMFPEQSKRSGVFYFFRKGFPTVAVSYNGSPGGRVLACLCLHPMGYHSGTWAGAMCPTDEVISALLLMRGDERRFWAKSGQWKATDTRSGL